MNHHDVTMYAENSTDNTSMYKSTKINPVQPLNTLLHSNKDTYVQNVHACIHLYTYAHSKLFGMYPHRTYFVTTMSCRLFCQWTGQEIVAVRMKLLSLLVCRHYYFYHIHVC